MGFFDHNAQARAVDRLQRQMWRAVVEQIRRRQEEGLRQVDLAERLGISPPQVHLWLTDPSRLTLKAAARLMLAMEGEFAIAASEKKLSTGRGA